MLERKEKIVTLLSTSLAPRNVLKNFIYVISFHIHNNPTRSITFFGFSLTDEDTEDQVSSITPSRSKRLS